MGRKRQAAKVRKKRGFKGIIAKLSLTAVVAVAVFVGFYHVVAAPDDITLSSDAKISFTFDDGYASSLEHAAPVLAQHGYTGVNYVNTGCIEGTQCRDTSAPYLTWAQVVELKDTYGWEIGSHTVTHPYMASTDAQDQPAMLTQEQIAWELAQSKADLAAHGIDAKAFASPFGDYSPAVLAEVAKHYTSHRGFADTGYNTWPYSDYLLRVQQVQAGVSADTVKQYIDTAAQNGQWLVLVFHDIRDVPDGQIADYEYSKATLNEIAAYAKQRGIKGVNISDALAASDTNLLPNSTFNNGISDGWTTDRPDVITADSGNRGSYPDAQNAVKLVSTTTSNAHLFSPKVPVNAGTEYLLKSFLNIESIARDEIGFYIDEYDANGNWISGQYKIGEWEVFAESVNFTYTPSSNNVATASLQVIAAANSQVVAYFDNPQWFPVTSVDAPIEPTDPVEPPKPEAVLILGSSFDNGFEGGWTTDDANNIVSEQVDGQGRVKLTAPRSGGNGHFFSPLVDVQHGQSYSWNNHFTVTSRAGDEIGFYIDEYDANGNWISGQYKGGLTELGSRLVSYGYQPTSSQVTKVRLQIITVPGSGITAYLDAAEFYKL